jgi:DNA modification methylase
MARQSAQQARKPGAVDIRECAVADLIPYANNARTHSETQVAQIAASIREFGFNNPVLIDGGKGIIAGHGRVLAARKLGLATVPVIELAHLSESQKRAYILADNKLAEQAGWDRELLALELGDLGELGVDLTELGFGSLELDELLGLGTADPKEEATPEPPAVPVSRLGDLWCLGPHRLLCGDATKPDCVTRVLNGVKPHLMATDPPFGVNYDPDWRNRAGASETKRTGKVLNDHRADWREAWALFPGDVAYVWHGALHATTVADSLIATGFDIRSQIIWAKERHVLSRGHYHWQHEPCQPGGTLVQKVVERGAGSQPARIEEVPIETLQTGDHVVSYSSCESVIRRRGREITHIGSRPYLGLMHTISAAGRVTRATPEHRFSARLNPDAAHKQVVYLMRRGDWWRVGRVALFNSRGFGLATRLADNRAEEAWIVSVHQTAVTAQCAEQVLSCRYGIPTTHWEVDNWSLQRGGQRSPDMIAGIYGCLDMSALEARAALLLRDHRLERAHPFLSSEDQAIFSRRKTRLVRACNLFAGILQIPMPTAGEAFEWVTVSGNDAAPFSGPVWSMDVDKDQHYVADGLVTHNCWYAVRGKGHWSGDRKQSTLWSIPSRDQDATTIHGTQKPVECMRRPMLNNASPGQAVYEPFSGSGTSIIAAESCERVCLAMELDPAYVDVAVLRWQAFTGKEAVLEGDGGTFAEVTKQRTAGEVVA